jgi:hypothetical protein
LEEIDRIVPHGIVKVAVLDPPGSFTSRRTVAITLIIWSQEVVGVVVKIIPVTKLVLF